MTSAINWVEVEVEGDIITLYVVVRFCHSCLMTAIVADFFFMVYGHALSLEIGGGPLLVP